MGPRAGKIKPVLRPIPRRVSGLPAGKDGYRAGQPTPPQLRLTIEFSRPCVASRATERPQVLRASHAYLPLTQRSTKTHNAVK